MSKIGDYRHRVAIEAPTVNKSGTGVETTTFSKIGSAWASIEPLAGREYWAAAQMQSEITHEIKMRYPGFRVTAQHRIVFGDRVFDIVVPRNIGERNIELVLLCKERAT